MVERLRFGLVPMRGGTSLGGGAGLRLGTAAAPSQVHTPPAGRAVANVAAQMGRAHPAAPRSVAMRPGMAMQERIVVDRVGAGQTADVTGRAARKDRSTGL